MGAERLPTIISSGLVPFPAIGGEVHNLHGASRLRLNYRAQLSLDDTAEQRQIA